MQRIDATARIILIEGSEVRTGMSIQVTRFVQRSYRSLSGRLERLYFNHVAGPLAYRRNGFDEIALRAIVEKESAAEALVAMPWQDVWDRVLSSGGSGSRPAALVLQGIDHASEGTAWSELRSDLFLAGYVPLRWHFSDAPRPT